MKNVLIIGGAGFVGQSLASALIERGDHVTVLDLRRGALEHDNIRYYERDIQGTKLPPLPPHDAVINLAGVTIAGRFTDERKKLIWSSRITGTRMLRQWLETQSWTPTIYIGASAVGYYGNRGSAELSIKSKPGNDFLATVCIDWEREHHSFERIGTPTIILRQGHILDRGGFLARLYPWYNHGFRMILGNGSQYLPWIDLCDLIRIYLSGIDGQLRPGTYNATAGSAITFRIFSRIFATVTGAWAPFPVPEWILSLFMGELGHVLVSSQRIQPDPAIAPLLHHGDLESSLRRIYDDVSEL